MSETTHVLTQADVYAIMQSDMKLRERAKTEVEGKDIIKTLVLPWNIGEFSVRLEGGANANAQQKRDMLSSWGAIVRGRVEEVISDESIQARAAKQAADRQRARDDAEAESQGVGQADSEDSLGDSGTYGDSGEQAVPKKAGAGPVQAHAFADEADAPAGTDFIARGEWLRERIERGEEKLREWKRELRAIDAALEILNKDEE